MAAIQCWWWGRAVGWCLKESQVTWSEETATAWCPVSSGPSLLWVSVPWDQALLCSWFWRAGQSDLKVLLLSKLALSRAYA